MRITLLVTCGSRSSREVCLLISTGFTALPFDQISHTFTDPTVTPFQAAQALAEFRFGIMPGDGKFERISTDADKNHLYVVSVRRQELVINRLARWIGVTDALPPDRLHGDGLGRLDQALRRAFGFRRSIPQPRQPQQSALVAA